MVDNSPGVANDAARIRPVFIRAAALGYLDDRMAVVSRDAHDHVIQGLGPDFPAKIGSRTFVPAFHLHREQPLMRVRGALQRARRRSDRAVVEVHSNEVESRPRLLMSPALMPIAASGRKVRASGYRPRRAGSRN